MSKFHQSAARTEEIEGWSYTVSSAVGEDAKTISDSADEIRDRQISGSPINKILARESSESTPKPVSEQLYDSLAQIKILTSQVAMHLDADWRNLIFDQLDDLLDAEYWHDDDAPIKAQSFETFLRMIVYFNPSRRPGFGVSNRGYLIGAWTNGLDRLTIEFMPDDVVKWVLSCKVDRNIEKGAGETPVRRLMKVLDPYNPSRWFLNASY